MVRDREAWRAAVHEVAESDMIGRLNSNIYICPRESGFGLSSSPCYLKQASII